MSGHKKHWSHNEAEIGLSCEQQPVETRDFAAVHTNSYTDDTVLVSNQKSQTNDEKSIVTQMTKHAEVEQTVSLCYLCKRNIFLCEKISIGEALSEMLEATWSEAA